ncbi:hypothetical protein HDV05_001098 [Chytridiales sp. JEL 0842]|nr:hypothetical protein HDV05_001098 [Chytridiales sp. JEL 0842]
MSHQPNDPSTSTSTNLPSPQFNTYLQDEIVPIRVHDPQLVDVSDTDSVSSRLEEDDPDFKTLEDTHNLEERLKDHRRALEAAMTDWNVKPLLTSERLVVKPTASMMDHMLLHPAIYSFLKPVGEHSGLNALATFLGAPPDWQDRFTQAFTGVVARSFQRLQNFPPETTAESEIQSHFISAVGLLAGMLGIDVSANSERKTIVGGFLAHSDLNVKTNTDASFTTYNNYTLLASEIKTANTFPLGAVYYRKSRYVQTLSALYGLRAPVFLFTQQHWKLFLESDDRRQVHTYPFTNDGEMDDHVRSTEMAKMDDNFAKAIAICLMAGVEREKEQLQSFQQPIAIATSNETPQKDTPKNPGSMSSQQEPSRRSARLASLRPRVLYPYNEDVDDMPTPAFQSGFDAEGNAVYTTIRVMSEDEIEEIEREEAEFKSDPLVHHSSADTLID